MTTILLISMTIAFALIAWVVLEKVKGASRPRFSNVTEGTHEGSITKKTDAALSTRFSLVKIGSDADHIAVCGAGDRPLGIATDEAEAAEDNLNVNLLGSSSSTQKAVASEAIAVGDSVFTAASGKVQNEPGGAGTYYLVGRGLDGRRSRWRGHRDRATGAPAYGGHRHPWKHRCGNRWFDHRGNLHPVRS